MSWHMLLQLPGEMWQSVNFINIYLDAGEIFNERWNILCHEQQL